MSTDRTIRLTPQQLALKLATRDAVDAAGGQVFVARETGRCQSRISDYCSDNTAEFMPLNLVEKVEALSAGAPGYPHITRALARSRGVALSGARAAAYGGGLDDLGDWLALVARENADLSSVLAGQDLAQGCDALTPAARERILRESGQLIAVLEHLCQAIGRDRVVPMRRSDSS